MCAVWRAVLCAKHTRIVIRTIVSCAYVQGTRLLLVWFKLNEKDQPAREHKDQRVSIVCWTKGPQVSLVLLPFDFNGPRSDAHSN